MTEIIFNQLNVKIFNAINYFAGNNIILNKFIIIIAKYLPFLFILFLLYLWFSKNKLKNFALYSGYSATLGIFLNFLISLFYFHPRPFVNHLGTLLIHHSSETSFPSDHTTFMLSIAFMLLYFKKTRKAGILLSIIGIIGGIARVCCGVHYPFDILGSIIVAIIASSIIFLSKEELEKLNNLIINLYLKLQNKICYKNFIL